MLSTDLGAFIGAVVVTPVGAWVETRRHGPPSLATMMPAFWLLVPGAVGLSGAAQFVGAGRVTGAAHFVLRGRSMIAARSTDLDSRRSRG